jgi:hypothetical protein
MTRSSSFSPRWRSSRLIHCVAAGCTLTPSGCRFRETRAHTSTVSRSAAVSPSASGRYPRPPRRASARRMAIWASPAPGEYRVRRRERRGGEPGCPGSRAGRIRAAAPNAHRSVGSNGRKVAVARGGDRRHLIHPRLPRRELTPVTWACDANVTRACAGWATSLGGFMPCPRSSKSGCNQPMLGASGSISEQYPLTTV